MSKRRKVGVVEVGGADVEAELSVGGADVELSVEGRQHTP